MAYTYFSPASVDVISRIEHMEQVIDVDVYCRQLHEDGMLEKTTSVSGIEEYRLSSTGRDIVQGTTKLNVPTTKYAIFQQLRSKEHKNALLRSELYILLRDSRRFMCMLEIHTILKGKLSIPELSSVLYGLLFQEKISVCGPLYGCQTRNVNTVDPLGLCLP
jgi:hypothetical protein